MLVEIYTKPGCPQCEKAKSILKMYGYNYKEYEMGRNITREELKARFPAAKFVPIIIVDNVEKNINDLQLLLETGDKL